MSVLVICAAAFAASCLTFFSGFGLGTILLPVFSWFVPVDQAVAATAVVHFLNGLLKLALTWRHVERGVVLRFGLPAIAAALVGAWLLERLAATGPLLTYEAFGRTLAVTSVKLTVGVVLFAFSLLEVMPWFQSFAVPPRFMPLGGLISGFFGGLSGLQGAVRSAFLVRAGLSKEAFIATGAAVACLVDCSRLGVYAASLRRVGHELDHGLLAAAVAAAFAGAVLGSRVLGKMTMDAIRNLVATMLCFLALAIMAGML